MQITANSTSLVSIALTSPATPTKDVAVPALIDESVSDPLPAVLVSFTGLREASDLYEQPKLVDIVQMSSTQDKGEVAAKISQSLATDATSLRKSKSPFVPSSFFSQVGALSRETTSYKNSAFSYQLASTKATEKLKLENANTDSKPKETVTLRVRTKEGDVIDIKIQHSRGTIGDSLEFSFDVTGKLSEAEQDALEKLANKLGQVADDFFRTGTTALHGLKEFDQANLKDFRIEFSKPKSSDTYTTLSYDFSVDEQSGTQHLSAKDGDGYSVDITANLQNLMGIANPSFNQSLDNYLKIIRETLNEHRPTQQENTNSASMRFLIDSFTSMLSPAISREQPASNLTAENALQAFDTGLPDFTAVINAPLFVFRDPKHMLTIPEAMTLRMEQRTEKEAQADGSMLIRQTNSFERQSKQIEGMVGSDKGDLKHGNFDVRTIHEKQQTSRILNITEKEINDLVSEHTEEKETTIENFRNFILTDTQTSQNQKHQITQLLDEINKNKQLKQTFNNLKALEDSHRDLFS